MMETRFNCISDFSDAVGQSVAHSKVPTHSKEDLRGWPRLGNKAWLVDGTGAQWGGGSDFSHVGIVMTKATHSHYQLVKYGSLSSGLQQLSQQLRGKVSNNT